VEEPIPSPKLKPDLTLKIPDELPNIDYIPNVSPYFRSMNFLFEWEDEGNMELIPKDDVIEELNSRNKVNDLEKLPSGLSYK
jgi:hypothetical protein